MTSIIKQTGYFLVPPSVLDVSPHVAAAIYSYGSSSHTSELNSSCAQVQLPKISGHQDSGYRLNIRSLNASDERVDTKSKEKKRTERSDEQEKKANKPSKSKSSAKAKKQQPMPSE